MIARIPSIGSAPWHGTTGCPALARLFVAPAVMVLGAMNSGVQAQSQLLAPTEIAAELAYSVALDGSLLAAGAPGAALQSGQVFTYACVGQNCAAPTALAPVELLEGDLFGSSVSVSSNTLAVGAPGQGAGSVYIFVNDGPGWSLQQKLTATPLLPAERFGTAVAVDGDRIAIGAPGADGGAGAIYVFERVGVIWSQSDRLQALDASAGDELGSSVSLDAGFVLAGAPQWAPALAGAYSQGAAYVFEFVSPGWVQQARLLPTVPGNGDTFAHAVSLSGNRAAIGAPLADLRIGSTYIFERAGPTWSAQAQLLAPVGLPGDRFGWSVSLDGDQLVIGAPFALEGCGGSTLFAYSAGIWSASTDPALSRTLPGGLVGWSVASNGQSWMVGVPGYSGAPSHVGAALWRDGADGIFNDNFDNVGTEACLAPKD